MCVWDYGISLFMLIDCISHWKRPFAFSAINSHSWGTSFHHHRGDTLLFTKLPSV